MKIKKFQEFINEAEAVKEQTKFKFVFPTGLYKQSEIPGDQLKKLKMEIVEKILRPLTGEKLYDGATIVNLVASTSNLRVSPELKSQLEKEGFKVDEGDASGNSALAKARLKTIKDIIFDFLGVKNPNDKSIQNIIQVKESVKVNAGEGKENQYISADVEMTGTPYQSVINCDMEKPLEFKGGKGTEEKNYVGFSTDDQKIGLNAAPNTKITLFFEPANIPDCFFVYLDINNYKLTPFIGNRSDKNRKDGTDFFINSLNDLKGSLLEKITKEVSKKIGMTKAKDLVNKTLLDKSGKIKVIQRDDADGEENFSVTLVKSIFKKTVDIKVFSPLDDTGFSLTTACTNPKVDFDQNELIAQV
jgi:hypothetical protein